MINITEANKEDLFLLSFIGESFIARSISSKFITFNQTNFFNALVNLTQSNVAKIWIAKDGEEIAGAICLLYTPNVYNSDELLGDIYFIDVLPNYQKQGLAKRLMTTAEDYAKEIGVIMISLAFKSEEIADRLCNSMGYTKFEYRIAKRIGDEL